MIKRARTTAMQTLFLSLILATGSLACNNTAKPIILWDIHHVLLTPSGPISTILNYKDLRKTFTHMNIWLIKDFISFILHGTANKSSEPFLHVARKYNNPYLEQLVIQVTNAQAPMPGMHEIVDELHHAGYEQHVGSNIGITPFRAIIDPRQYPKIAPLFEHIDTKKSQVVSLKNGTEIVKPNPRFFKQYLRKNNITDLQKTPVIFIDDNIQYVTAARKLGIDGILFKNADQLRTELRKKNVAITPAQKRSMQIKRHTLGEHLSTKK